MEVKLIIFSLVSFLFHNRALDGHFWWAVGILAPHVGAILGALLYMLMAMMRSTYVDNTQQTEPIPPLNPERDLIYQKGMKYRELIS